MIETYILTGFLESGKTTLLNHLVKTHLKKHKRLLVAQFERGPVSLTDLGQSPAQALANASTKPSSKVPMQAGHAKRPPARSASLPRVVTYYLSKKEREARPDRAVADLLALIRQAERDGDPFDQLWIEWNGVSPFSELHAMFLPPAKDEHQSRPTLDGICRIRSVICLVDGHRYKALMNQDRSPLPEQIMNADFVIVTTGSFKETRREIHRLAPHRRVIPAGSLRQVMREMNSQPFHPLTTVAIGLLVFALLWLVIRPLISLRGLPLDNAVLVFLGIILQALPFLLLGVLISSAIQVFIPQGWLEDHFPKGKLSSLLFAVVAGFFLPVCDCASIPVFQSLVRKGVPLPSAVTFMVASPIINPVVLLSTSYAFTGYGVFIWGRFLLGILLGLLVGLSYYLIPDRSRVMKARPDRVMCSCGVFTAPDGSTSARDKFDLYVQHIRVEFFDILRYLILAATVSSVLQVFFNISRLFTGADHFVLAILIMMAAAFLLSLCSSSDAVIARSFAPYFPLSALMGFLVFGPVMDLKNVIMLSGTCDRRFIIRLFATTAVACFVLILAFHYLIPVLGAPPTGIGTSSVVGSIAPALGGGR